MYVRHHTLAYHLHLVTYSPDLFTAATHGCHPVPLCIYISKANKHILVLSPPIKQTRALLHLITSAVVPLQKQRQQSMIRHQASCHGRRIAMWRGRWGWGLRVRHGGGVRLRLLLRVRLRLSGIVGLLLRSVEELRCRPGGRACSRWSAPRASSRPAPIRRTRLPERDQSSFYAEAIADCLEFIKSRSSYTPTVRPVNDGRV